MKLIFSIATALALTSAPALSQDHSAMHASMQSALPALPTEPGNGSFAAIAEIVAMLSADPLTDWSAVDISALQAHLLDMDSLVRNTTVSSQTLPDGVRMILPTSNEAALRMVPAHAPVLAADTGWDSEVEIKDGNIHWRVTSQNAAGQIQALGIFGLMATGAHHQEHHLAIATGNSMH